MYTFEVFEINERNHCTTMVLKFEGPDVDVAFEAACEWVFAQYRQNENSPNYKIVSSFGVLDP